jgi:hypothetical protein
MLVLRLRWTPRSCARVTQVLQVSARGRISRSCETWDGPIVLKSRRSRTHHTAMDARVDGIIVSNHHMSPVCAGSFMYYVELLCPASTRELMAPLVHFQGVGGRQVDRAVGSSVLSRDSPRHRGCAQRAGARQVYHSLHSGIHTGVT